MKFQYIIFLLLSLTASVFSQRQPGKIIVENADFQDINQYEIPDAVLLTGNVRVNHEGVIMTCNKAYFFQKENYIKAFGQVQMVQGDTLYLNSKYAEYNGNVKKAYATGDVVMRSPESSLVTDTIHFDRMKQEAFYRTKGVITNRENTLKSNSGTYYVKEKKYRFLTAVELKNPQYVIQSNHLDYYTNSGHSYLFGPSTITGKDNFIYTENGFYNTKKNVGHFLQKSYIKYKERLIEGDSLYFDRTREFSSGTRNVKITDAANKAIVKGHYAEIFKKQDSVYITKRASVRYQIEKDSMFVHAKKIFLTGKAGERIIRGQKNVRFYKTDMSGKCDSIHSDQKTAVTKLIGRPILWNNDKQLTGDVMHLIGNNTTEKLDSLKVLNNAFIISKDTLNAGFNQIKGVNLYGKFSDNKLYEVDVVKNNEVIYFTRNDQNELIGIEKSACSRINMVLENGKIDTITFFNKNNGTLYPENEFPENVRKLRGFVWRIDEKLQSKEAIFPDEENTAEASLQNESEKDKANASKPMPIRKETLNYDKKKGSKPKK